MKTYKFTKQHVIIAIMFTLMFIGYNAIGQSLKINGKVLFNDKSTIEKFKVSVVDLDVDSTYTIETINGFNSVLKYNKNYLIVISKQGFQTKAVAVDTHCDTDKSFKYFFYVNLINTEPVIPDAQFAGGIYYNENKKQFDYYLR